MNTQNTLTVEQKLLQIGNNLGYPFAINAFGTYVDNDGINHEKGLQAWSCEEDEEGAGVEIFVFPDENFVKEDYDISFALYEEIEEAEFFVDEDEKEVFFFENADKLER